MSGIDARLVALLCDLCARQSVTPKDAGCQRLLAARLAAQGFQCDHMRFGEVDNLWARLGTEAPCLAFVGHTDVVPTGPSALWTSPPFTPTITDDRLRARGAVDMKGSLAAMIIAIEDFVAAGGLRRGSLAFCVTSDEEGPAHDGIAQVVTALQQRQALPDWAVVGEPSGEHRLGDRIRIGRRGSLNGHITYRGTQGHVAYPERIDNACFRLAQWSEMMRATVWDQAHDFYPATSFQVTQLDADSGAANVTPVTARARFNLRFSPHYSGAALLAAIEEKTAALGGDYAFEWAINAEPFLTPPTHPFIADMQATITDLCGAPAALSASGGTSDGRFLAPAGVAVVELGPVAAGLHAIDEDVSLSALTTLAHLYQRLMARLLR